MSRGGIFSKRDSLGAYQPLQCSITNSDLVRKLQQHLKDNGFPSIRVDGEWLGCSSSAYIRKYGHAPTTDEIASIVGRPCTSGALWGNQTDFWSAAGNTCQDGSDQGGGGTGTQSSQCPSGQVWNDLIKQCVPDVFGQNKDGGGGTTPIPGDCQKGYSKNPWTGLCVPDAINALPNTTQPEKKSGDPITDFFGNLLGGGGKGGALPGGAAPSECAQGMYKNPLTGKCSGQGGVEQPPTECPPGAQKIAGTCYALPGGFPGTTTPGTTTGGDCPAGQFKDPILGKCWPNPISGGGGSATPPGTTTTGVDPISILQQIVGMLKTPEQPVHPVVSTVETAQGIFGKYGIGIAALIGATVVGGAIYYVRKNRSQQFEDEDYLSATGDVVPGVSGDDILLEAMGSLRQDRDEEYYEESDYGYTPNRRRGRKSGKKTSRRSRK